MSSKTFLQLVTQSHIITEALVEADGELTPEIEKLIEQSSLDLSDKMDRYYFVMRDLEQKAALAKERAAEWTSIAKLHSNALERMQERVLYGLQELGVTEIAGREVTFKRQVNPPKAVVNDESLIEPQYLKTEVVAKIDKAKIAADLKAGKDVKGAHLERGERLVAKAGNLLKAGAT